MPNKPKLSFLTYVGFHLISAIDHGKGANVTFDDIYRGLEHGTLLTDLTRKVPNTFDFSLFPAGSEDEAGLLEVLRPAAEGLRGRERRKTGVENSGLCLLAAFILEVIQQKEWEE